jgi:hypothetical protein
MQTEKQPKTKNQTAPNRTMGRGTLRATHPHKEQKAIEQTKTNQHAYYPLNLKTDC